MRFLIKVICTALAVWVVTFLPLDVQVVGGDGEWWTRALVFGFIGLLIVSLNAVVRPVITVLSIPCLILTLGLFSVIITWFILYLTSWITTEFVDFAQLHVGSFWQTLFAAVIIAIVSTVIEAILPGKDKKK